MPEKVRRPISIWIAQVILLIFGCACGISFLYGLLEMTLRKDLPPSVFDQLIWLSCIRFGLAMLFLAGFWGMVKRKKYGRWLGVAGFLACITIVGIGAYSTFDRNDYPGVEDKLVWTTAIGVFLAPLLLFVLILVLSRRVSGFFSPAAAPESRLIPEPPPPPSFENENAG
jgi:hypothetical protein